MGVEERDGRERTLIPDLLIKVLTLRPRALCSLGLLVVSMCFAMA
jgi:hypothetical protein